MSPDLSQSQSSSWPVATLDLYPRPWSQMLYEILVSADHCDGDELGVP